LTTDPGSAGRGPHTNPGGETVHEPTGGIVDGLSGVEEIFLINCIAKKSFPGIIDGGNNALSGIAFMICDSGVSGPRWLGGC